MHKSKLNELCQKNRWGSPMYSFIKDGEEHNPNFRGSVVVNGSTFISQSVFKSSKFAHDDAAQQALNHFTTFTLSTMDMQNTKQRKVSTMSSSSSSSDNVSTADVHNTKRQKVSTMSSCGSDSDNDVPSKNNELSSLALAEEKTTIALLDSMYEDSYLLCNKERQHTSIPTTMLPTESVVLPIEDKKRTIMSLE